MDPIPPIQNIPPQNPSIPIPENPNLLKQDLPTLRTYATDMAEALKRNEGSVMKIAIAEANRRDEQGAMVEKEKSKSWIYVMMGIVFVFLAGAAFYFFHFYSNQTLPTVTDETATQNSFVYADASTTVNVDGFAKGTLIGALSAKLMEPFTAGAIENVYLEHGDSKTPFAKDEFVAAVGPSASSTLSRALGAGYMLGAYKSLAGNEPFIVLEISDFDIVFAEMLKWEPKMLNDLGTLFSLGELPSSLTLSRAPFADQVYANQDTRIIINPDTNLPVLFYAFLDTRTLLIARNPALMNEIQNRIVTKHAGN